eukprot:gene6884-6735_t
MLFVLLTVAGFIAFGSMKVQNFPDLDVPTISVTASLPGVAPSQLETDVARKLENALAPLQGLKHITTKVQDGVVSITAEFRMEKPSQEAVDDVRSAIQGVRADLPGDLRDPVVQKLNLAGSPVLAYTVRSSRMDDEALSWLVDKDITRKLLSLRGVGAVNRVGGVTREVRVALDVNRLQSLGITAAEVSRQLKQVQQEGSGGRMDLGAGEQPVRTLATVKTAQEVGQIELATSRGGRVRLDQVATVSDTLADARSAASLNGVPVVGFEVVRSKGESEVAVGRLVRQALAEYRLQNPDIEITESFDFVTPVEEEYNGSLPIVTAAHEPGWLKRYMVWATWCMKHRLVTMVLATLFFIGSIMLVPLLPKGFIPPDDNSQTQVYVELPPGSTLAQTQASAEHARTLLMTVNDVKSVYTTIGGGSAGSDPFAGGGAAEVRKATLTIQLSERGTRPRKQVIENDIRTKLQQLPGVRSKVGLGGSGEKYVLVLTGEDPQALQTAAMAVERDLRTIQGLGSIASTASLVRPEIAVRPDFAKAADLGVTSAAISDTLRVATLGDYDAALPKLNLSERQVPIVVNNKVAVVVGGGSGMGAAVARKLAQDGFQVAVLSSSGKGEALGRELGGLGLTGSNQSSEDLQKLVDQTMARWGRIDVLVNSAGHGPKGPVLELTDAQWHLGLEMYFLNVVRAVRLVAPIMVQQKSGSIVNISTAWVVEPSAMFPTSAVARAGLAAFTKLFADEHAAHNVRMNNVLPGWIDSLPAQEQRRQSVPMQRYGTSEEVAATIAFLASEGAAYITGQNIRVDGGLMRSV